MSPPSADSFTSNECLILTSWFEGTDCDDLCDRADVDEALNDRGYTEPVGSLYTRHQAAVAGIVLDSYQHRLLFQRGARRVVSNAIRRRRRKRLGTAPDDRATVRRLFTVWSSAGPSTSWGNMYGLVWLPAFERFVVTDSTDDEEPYEHTDFAIGHFGPCDDENAAAMELIEGHWRRKRGESVDDEAPVMEVQPGSIVAGVVEKCLEAVWKPEDDDDEAADDDEEPFDEFADPDDPHGTRGAEGGEEAQRVKSSP